MSNPFWKFSVHTEVLLRVKNSALISKYYQIQNTISCSWEIFFLSLRNLHERERLL